MAAQMALLLLRLSTTPFLQDTTFATVLQRDAVDTPRPRCIGASASSSIQGLRPPPCPWRVLSPTTLSGHRAATPPGLRSGPTCSVPDVVPYLPDRRCIRTAAHRRKRGTPPPLSSPSNV